MADLITVKSGRTDGKVALWEKHPDHPEGEVYIAGEGVFTVALTSLVQRQLNSGELIWLEIKAEEPTPEPEPTPTPAPKKARAK